MKEFLYENTENILIGSIEKKFDWLLLVYGQIL